MSNKNGDVSMCVRKAIFKFKEKNLELARIVAEKASPLLMNPDIQGVYFITNDESREYGSITIWKSREAMDAASPQLREKVQEFAGHLIESVSIEVYEILELKKQ